MKFFDRIRQKVRSISAAHKFLYHPYLALMYRLPSSYRKEWIKRIDDVLNCSDSKYIKRGPNAGKIINGYQIMHNGLKIIKDSYYAYPITKMLNLTRGVHEPQEELAFSRVLKNMPKEQ